jgi:cell division septation protein DedD
MTPVTNSAVSETLTSAAETASSNMSAELAPVSNTTINTPEVDHVPVLSSVLAEDPKPKPKPKPKAEAETEAENTAEKHKKQHKKSPVTEMSSVSHDDEEVPEDDDDEIPVNELIKNYQARLDASLDMIRNLRAD